MPTMHPKEKKERLDRDLEWAKSMLLDRGFSVTDPVETEPLIFCAAGNCMMTEQEHLKKYKLPMCDVTVEIMKGQDGHASVKRYVCYDHIDYYLSNLKDLGFDSHRHIDMNYLENKNCPGVADKEACDTLTKKQQKTLHEER